MEIVKTENLTKKHKKKIIVNNLNLTINEGEIYGLVGNEKAGKSSVVKMILGLHIPTSGKIHLFEHDDLLYERKKIGFLIDSPSFDPSLPAYENLKFFSIQNGFLKKEEQKKVIEDMLSIVGLDYIENIKLEKYPDAMQQRLAFAFALLRNPPFLILDEPFTDLDKETIEHLKKILLKRNKEYNTTILITSKNTDSLKNLATKFGFLKNGELIKEVNGKKVETITHTYIKITTNDIEKTILILKKMGGEDFETPSENTIILNNITDKFNEIEDKLYGSKLNIDNVELLEEYLRD